MARNSDVEQRLTAYIEASQSARAVLSELHGLELNDTDIQAALVEVLEIPAESPLGVLDRGLTATQIVETLRTFNFKKLHPEILSEFTEDQPLVPEGIPRLLTEQTIKVKGEVWRVHKNDADPFPSIPHAHNYESGMVLHLGSGEMFDRNRQSVGFIVCKKLVRIRGELSAFELPETTCK